VAAREVAAIGIANQRETTVLWERASGRALVPRDRLAGPPHRRVLSACAPRAGRDVRARTGLLLDPYFSATKLAWLLDHVPDARVRAERGELAFGTVDSWLLWHLSGGRLHVTDAGNAARTLLFNLHTRRLGSGVARALPHPARAAAARGGEQRGVRRDRSGAVRAAVPIAGIGGDQQAATFGQACLAPGMAKNTYGTGCFLLHEHRRMCRWRRAPPADHRGLDRGGCGAQRTRSRAACSWAVRWCSGCATASGW
jgi:glycerol kinase